MTTPAVAHYARLSCGCTVDFYENEWRAFLAFTDRLPVHTVDCPKCTMKGVHMIASWKPTEREEVWS